MYDTTFLETIAEGDRIVVVRGGGVLGDGKYIALVQRVTKTQVRVIGGGAGGRVFRRADGYEVGGSRFHRWRIEAATPQNLEACQRRMAIEDIETAGTRIRKTQLPTEALVAMAAAIKPLLNERV